MRQPSEALVDLTRAEGLCAEVCQRDGYICTRKVNHGTKHKAVLQTVDTEKDVVVAEWSDPKGN